MAGRKTKLNMNKQTPLHPCLVGLNAYLWDALPVARKPDMLTMFLKIHEHAVEHGELPWLIEQMANVFDGKMTAECNVEYKAKYEKCINVIKRFDPGIVGMYDL